MEDNTHVKFVKRHHYGRPRNDRLILECETRPEGSPGYDYKAMLDGVLVAHVMFQNGQRGAKGSTPGLTDEALIAVSIDRVAGLTGGSDPCPYLSEAKGHLVEALKLMKARAAE